MKRLSFRLILVLLGLPMFVALADWAWTQGPVFKYRIDGASAYYFTEDDFEGFTENGYLYGNRSATVNLTEGAEAIGTGGISGPFFVLDFQVSVSTSEGYGSAGGSGPISAQYVTLAKSDNRGLSLTVDTNLLEPPFYRYQYGDIPVQFPTIELRWTRANNDWYRWEGHQIQNLGFLFLHAQGSGIRYYTIPNGAITLPDVGVPILWSFSDGWLGSQKGWTWYLQRDPKP